MIFSESLARCSHMRMTGQILIGAAMLWASAASAQPAATLADVVVCATAADARSYAKTHKDAIQNAIAREITGKACVVAKIAFVPGKQSDRLEQKDATYAVTEIMIVGVSTPLGVLGVPPNPAYTLLRLQDQGV
jgi:hypothetical protein